MKKKTFAIILTVSALLAAGVIAFVFYQFYQTNFGGNNLDSYEFSESDMRKVSEITDTVNVLCIGVDYSQELTDVLMYVRFDPKAKKAKVLSIPRDSFVGDEYPSGKINNIYKATKNVDELVEEIENRFRLPVDYYAMITLEALGSIVDQMGGVEITLEEDLWDYGVKAFSAGTQTITGEQAQVFVRIRHAYANADIGRIDAQHRFLTSVMHKLQSLGKLDTIRLVLGNFDEIETDIPATKAVSIASTAYALTEEDIEMFTVPGTGKWNNTYAVYEVDCAALAELLNEHFLSSPITADELDLPTVTAPQPASPPPAEEEPPEEVPESVPEEITEPIYPSIRDYDSLTDGNYDDWFKANTIYPEGWRAKKRTESSTPDSKDSTGDERQELKNREPAD